MRSLAFGFVATVIVAVGVAGSLGSAAAAGETGPTLRDEKSTSDEARGQDEQIPYFHARTLVLAAIDAAGVDHSAAPPSIDPDGNALVLAWVGPVPEWLGSATAAAEAATGVPIHITEASVTNSDLVAAAGELAALAPQNSLSSIGIGVDELTIRLAPAHHGAMPGETLAFGFRAEALANSLGIEITVQSTDETFQADPRFGDAGVEIFESGPST